MGTRIYADTLIYLYACLWEEIRRDGVMTLEMSSSVSSWDRRGEEVGWRYREILKWWKISWGRKEGKSVSTNLSFLNAHFSTWESWESRCIYWVITAPSHMFRGENTNAYLVLACWSATELCNQVLFLPAF